MKRVSIVAFGLIAFGFTDTALAQDKRVALGLRSGYALPMGKVWSAGTQGLLSFTDTKMGDAIAGQIPIWVDAGYFVTPDVLVGAYFQYGFVSVKTRELNGEFGCAMGASCSGHDIRLGVQGQYHFGAEQFADPWLGAGVGYEWLGISNTVNGVESSGTLSGFEFLNLQGGADFKLADAFAVGPFVSLSIGQYSSFHTEVQGTGIDIDLPKATHEWLTLGVKGTFGI